MPLVIGAAAIAFLLMALLTIITLYWVLTKWHDAVQGLPVIGDSMANVATYLRDRNEEIIRVVFGVAHSIVSWSADKVAEGFQILNEIYNAVYTAMLYQTITAINGLSLYVNNVLIPTVNSLGDSQKALAFLVHGFVQLNIDALNFWKDATSAALANYIMPNIAHLIIVTDTMAKVLLPGLQRQIDDVTRTALGWINGVGKDMRVELTNLQVTTAAVLDDPVKGVVPRVGAIEGVIGQVLPWAAAIGLSIPIARTLARVGRNPCTCLEEQGQTDMLPLLLYLFEEAG